MDMPVSFYSSHSLLLLNSEYLLEWLPISTWVDFKIAILTYILLSVRDTPIISYSSAA